MTRKSDAHPTKTDLLIEAVVDEAKVSSDVVKKILKVMNELELNDAEPKVVDGELEVGWISHIAFEGETPDLLLPEKLIAKIKALEFEIIELLPAILRHWQNVYGYPWPCIMVITPSVTS